MAYNYDKCICLSSLLTNAINILFEFAKIFLNEFKESVFIVMGIYSLKTNSDWIIILAGLSLCIF